MFYLNTFKKYVAQICLWSGRDASTAGWTGGSLFQELSPDPLGLAWFLVTDAQVDVSLRKGLHIWHLNSLTAELALGPAVKEGAGTCEDLVFLPSPMWNDFHTALPPSFFPKGCQPLRIQTSRFKSRGMRTG